MEADFGLMRSDRPGEGWRAVKFLRSGQKGLQRKAILLFADWRRERQIRKVLRELARQQVCGFDADHNAWIVERPLPRDEEAVRTCQARGWVEPMPHGAFEKQRASDTTASRAQVRIKLYRLTDSGWNSIHFTHAWVVATFVIALVTLFATVIGIAMRR